MANASMVRYNRPPNPAVGPIMAPMDEPPAGIRDFEEWSRLHPMDFGGPPGEYFPAIADNVGQWRRAPGMGIPTTMAPAATSSNLPVPMAEPTDYYPAIAQNVGLAPGQTMSPRAPAPGSPEFIGPMPDSGVGMGIPVAPSEAVTSVDIPASADASGISTALKALGGLGGGGGGFKMPTPTATSPRRSVGSRPEFIYTNPAAAQQAASNYAARLGAETGQERGYQDYLARMGESKNANERAKMQGDLQAQQLAAAQTEGAANRSSSERIAGTSETVRQARAAEAAWADNERAAELGEQSAAMLNADPNAKVDKKFAWINPVTGKWESRFRRQPRPAPPPSMGVPGAAPGPVPPPTQIAVPQPLGPPASPPTTAPPAAAPGASLARRAFDASLPGVLYRGYQAMTQ